MRCAHLGEGHDFLLCHIDRAEMIIKSVNAELDSRVMTLIDESFDYIGRIPEPFAQHLSDKEATDAIDKVNELVAALEEVYAELSKH